MKNKEKPIKLTYDTLQAILEDGTIELWVHEDNTIWFKNIEIKVKD